MPEQFSAYGGVHLAVLVAGAIVLYTVVRLGMRWRDEAPRREILLRRVWLAAIVVGQITNHVFAFSSEHYDAETSWPIHVCDVAIVFAFLALALRTRVTQVLLHFWGLVYSPFAFCLPTVEDGPARIGFWLFWVGHFQIVGSAIYSYGVDALRPERRDLYLAFTATVLYALVVLPIDVVFDVNYGFLGTESPATEFLGPWSIRVPLLLALQCLGCAMLFGATRARPCDSDRERGSSREDKETR